MQIRLHIPDQIGFFSPGPPPLQVDQAALFGAGVIATCMFGTMSGLFVLVLTLRQLPNVDIGKVRFLCASMTVALAAITWVGACCDKRREPGYEWADWKMRTE
jgi:hypothetical protein